MLTCAGSRRIVCASSTMLGASVAEKNNDCRLAGSNETMRFTSRRNPMSSIRSTSSSTKNSTCERSMWRWSIRSSKRPGSGHQHINAAAHGVHLRHLAHAAIDEGLAESHVFAISGETLADLAREFAGGGQHQRPAAARTDLARALMQRVAESAARNRRSCRCRSGRNLAGRGLAAAMEWPAPGSARARSIQVRAKRDGGARPAATPRMQSGSCISNARTLRISAAGGVDERFQRNLKQSLIDEDRTRAAS